MYIYNIYAYTIHNTILMTNYQRERKGKAKERKSGKKDSKIKSIWAATATGSRWHGQYRYEHIDIVRFDTLNC